MSDRTNSGRFVDTGLITLVSAQALQPLPCNLESTLKSVNSNTPTTIEFFNDASNPVSIYWLDYSGVRVIYHQLSAGQSYRQSTALTQPWVITNTAGQCLSIFLPVQGLGLAKVSSGLLP